MQVASALILSRWHIGTTEVAFINPIFSHNPSACTHNDISASKWNCRFPQQLMYQSKYDPTNFSDPSNFGLNLMINLVRSWTGIITGLYAFSIIEIHANSRWPIWQLLAIAYDTCKYIWKEHYPNAETQLSQHSSLVWVEFRSIGHSIGHFGCGLHGQSLDWYWQTNSGK